VFLINKLNRFVAKILGKPMDLNRYEALELCPIEMHTVAPAVYLPAHLQRVLGAHSLSSLELEHQRLTKTSATHGATTLYQIGKACLFRGGVWTKKREYASRLLRDDDAIYCVEMEKAVLTDSDIANKYFGHWLQDAVPASLIGTNEMPAISFRKPHYPHAQGYHDLFGLELIYANSGHVKDLYLINDAAQNSYKVKRYQLLRDRMQQALNPIDCAYKGVFIARGVSGAARTLINEQEVIDHLLKHGFNVVYPEKMTVADLMQKLWNAPLVITVEGSAQNHANYPIALIGSYLILQSPYLVNHVQKGICDAMNRPYGFYVCHPTQNPDEFYVDSMDDLDKVIDGLHNESAKRIVV
jgi:Glycosyltransferase 61